MPLVNTKKMFEMAYKHGYAVGAFNVNNMEITQGIADAVAQEKAPLILQISKGAREYAKNSYLLAIINVVVKENRHTEILPDFDRISNNTRFSRNASQGNNQWMDTYWNAPAIAAIFPDASNGSDDDGPHRFLGKEWIARESSPENQLSRESRHPREEPGVARIALRPDLHFTFHQRCFLSGSNLVVDFSDAFLIRFPKHIGHGQRFCPAITPAHGSLHYDRNVNIIKKDQFSPAFPQRVNVFVVTHGLSNALHDPSGEG